MKTAEFKKLIKESVREVFQEELKTLLLEAIKVPIISERQFQTKISQSPIVPLNEEISDSDIRNNIREMYANKMNGALTTGDLQKSSFIPRPVNTVGEGSALPEGEVGLDQITKLMNGGV